MPIRKGVRERVYRGKGRHPSLKLGSEKLLIWNYIDAHPGCTSEEITKNCQVNHQRISELIDEGLIEVVGKTGHFRRYATVHENVEGLGRVRVPVEVTVYINEFGEYSASARVIGQIPKESARYTSTPITPITRKTYSISVPNVDEPVRVQAKTGGLLLEGEYTIIDAE